MRALRECRFTGDPARPYPRKPCAGPLLLQTGDRHALRRLCVFHRLHLRRSHQAGQHGNDIDGVFHLVTEQSCGGLDFPDIAESRGAGAQALDQVRGFLRQINGAGNGDRQIDQGRTDLCLDCRSLAGDGLLKIGGFLFNADIFAPRSFGSGVPRISLRCAARPAMSTLPFWACFSRR